MASAEAQWWGRPRHSTRHRGGRQAREQVPAGSTLPRGTKRRGAKRTLLERTSPLPRNRRCHNSWAQTDNAVGLASGPAPQGPGI